jgi:hypothetical protein
VISLLYTEESIDQWYAQGFSTPDRVVLFEMDRWLDVNRHVDIHLPSVGLVFSVSISSLTTLVRTFGEAFQLYRTKPFSDSMSVSSLI